MKGDKDGKAKGKGRNPRGPHGNPYPPTPEEPSQCVARLQQSHAVSDIVQHNTIGE